MKKLNKAVALASIALCSFAFAAPAQAATTVIAPLKISVLHRCDFVDNGQCYDHWIPTVDSCRNIASSNAPAWEVAACWQRFGPGRRG
jgi:hypothetical protein